MQEIIVRSPGRINLIGEHTDYNNGWVLPAAIDKYVQVKVSRRTDDRILLVACQYQEQLTIALEDVRPQDQHWSNYVLGVVDQLLKKGLPLSGFRMTIDGDIPEGAGLSSSAAVECAVVYALSELFELKLSKLSMVLIAQAAEHTYPGVKCGIMDPYTSVFGKRGMALQLDCAKPAHVYVPLQLQGYKIVLLNTNVKHSLASSAYNHRREECEAVVQQVQAREKDVRSLRDVTLPMLYQYVADPTLRKRAQYVIRENARLQAGCEDLKIGDLESFGKKMIATHQGLRDDYEVSCPELDWLVENVAGEQGVLGARMMGGGFGGCTINLVFDDAIAPLWETLAPAYEKAMGRELDMYVVETTDGTSLVQQNNYADA